MRDRIPREEIEKWLSRLKKELKNLVREPAYESIRKELSEKHFSRLFNRLDEEKLRNMKPGGLLYFE